MRHVFLASLDSVNGGSSQLLRPIILQYSSVASWKRLFDGIIHPVVLQSTCMVRPQSCPLVKAREETNFRAQNRRREKEKTFLLPEPPSSSHLGGFSSSESRGRGSTLRERPLRDQRPTTRKSRSVWASCRLKLFVANNNKCIASTVSWTDW